MDTNSILDDADLEDLMEKHLASPSSKSGYHKVHKRRLHSTSDEENSDISLETTLESQNSDDAFAMIPDQLISKATIEYVGYTEEVATRKWDEWVNWPSDGPRRETDPDDGGLVVSFLDFITILPRDDPTGITGMDPNDPDGENDDTWNEFLSRCGMNTEFKLAIMDPEFKPLRLSRSCRYWTKDTIEERFIALEEIQRASWQRAMERKRHQKRNKSTSDKEALSSKPDSSSTGQDRTLPSGEITEAVSSSHQRQGPISGPQPSSVVDNQSESTTLAQAFAASNAPGSLILFKGISKDRTKGLLNGDGSIRDVKTLLSKAPTDCNGYGPMFYFTPNLKVAEYYTKYIKRRSTGRVVIVRIVIPNNAIKSLSGPKTVRIFWPDDNWRKMIWNGRRADQMPKELTYVKKATLIIASISKGVDSTYLALDSWKDVKEKHLLRLSDEVESSSPQPGIQYVFSGKNRGIDFLKEFINSGSICSCTGNGSLLIAEE